MDVVEAGGEVLVRPVATIQRREEGRNLRPRGFVLYDFVPVGFVVGLLLVVIVALVVVGGAVGLIGLICHLFVVGLGVVRHCIRMLIVLLARPVLLDREKK